MATPVEQHDPLSDVAWAVVVTVIAYWLAERWSEVLASHLRGEPLRRRRVFAVFGPGWPMVQASCPPLVVLGLSRALGASNTTALNLAGRRAGLTRLGGRRIGRFHRTARLDSHPAEGLPPLRTNEHSGHGSVPIERYRARHRAVRLSVLRDLEFGAYIARRPPHAWAHAESGREAT